jgi:PAS domain S-box-containing protein
MHYTGMASASYMKGDITPDLSHAVRISSLSAAGLGAVALTVLAVALLTSTWDRLQKGKVLLDELFEQAPQAIALTSADNLVVRVNREFTRLFGYTPQETQDRCLSELIIPGESRDEDDKYTALVAQGKRVDAEGVRRHKDGSLLDVSIVGVPVSLPGGQIATYAIYRDITERRRAEEQLKASSEQLRALSASLQAAREEEGIRIARELHDELGGVLTSLKWDLESLDKIISESSEQPKVDVLREKIAAMMRLSETTISAVRRISSELRPSVLDDLGLAEAVEWQALQFQTRTGIVCHCECSVENLDLNKEQSTAVFRIFQEALTNILRHAEATRVDVAITQDADEFVLTVTDNGRGISESKKSGQQSLGILGMRERAHLIGGEIEIQGVAGKGTVVIVRVQSPARTSQPR